MSYRRLPVKSLALHAVGVSLLFNVTQAQTKLQVSEGKGSLDTSELSRSERRKVDSGLFSKHDSLGPVGEVPFSAGSSYTPTLRSKKMLEIFDRKKNWIFNKPGDNKDRQGAEGELGKESLKGRWSDNTKATGFERFLNEGKVASRKKSSSTNKVDNAKYAFGEEAEDLASSDALAAIFSSGPSTRLNGGGSVKGSRLQGNTLASVFGGQRLNPSLDRVERTPGTGNKTFRFGTQSGNSGYRLEGTAGFSRFGTQRGGLSGASGLGGATANPLNSNTTLSGLNPLIGAGSSLMGDPTANSILGAQSKKTGLGNRGGSTKLNVWNQDGSLISGGASASLSGSLGSGIISGFSAPSEISRAGGIAPTKPAASILGRDSGSSMLTPAAPSFQWKTRGF